MPSTQLYWEDVREGDEIPALKKKLTKKNLVIYAVSAGDLYELHYDKDTATAQGFKDVIVHGRLKGALLAQAVTDWIGDEGRVKKLTCNNRGADYPGDEFTVKGKVTRKFEEGGERLVALDLWGENPAGEKTTFGTAVVSLPSKGASSQVTIKESKAVGKRLAGRNAVVTGGGRGIGRAVCLALAQEGANVVVCDLGVTVAGAKEQSSPADEVVEECKKLGVKAIANYGDVSKFKDAEAMIKACVDNFGRIDILCNIAGIDRPKMIWNMSEEEWDQVIAVHLKGTFNLTRHAAPLMREQRYGRIINCVSEAYQGGVSHINYAAAKGGIASFSYGTARELGRYGVTCNVFVPRASTRMVQGEEVMKMIQKRVEAGLMTQEKADEMKMDTMPPEYFANFIAFLASEEAGWINGQVFLTTPGALGLFSQPEIILQVRHDPNKEGVWTIEQCAQITKEKLLVKYKNPAPPEAPKDKK